MSSPAGGSPGPLTDEHLRSAFSALADGVQVHDDQSYARVSAGWKDRYRRRRLTVAILATIVFAAVDVVGLWALNSADSIPQVIFSDTEPPAGIDPGSMLGSP
ncbi:hypothetical protein [Pseudonocardia sp. TRM90224]|uniref:hypothetical protein n=1 Tax=Pseudonocardia sp. TRM90224 TaxID=2812678 RepID=UPI001E307682|nr:hypothetical protein [Pseudonocardia sp. TRM90224]